MSFLKPWSCCLASCLATHLATAQTAPEAPPKLEFLSATVPGLVASLGDPQLGLELQEWEMKWHPGGRLFTADPAGNFKNSRIQVWTPPNATELPRCKGTLTVGRPWVMSTRGDLLCGRWHAAEDKEGLLIEPYRNNTFSCFRFGDAQKLWTVNLEKEEGVMALCFTKDDTKVLMVSYRGQQSILHVLDAAAGTEESRMPLPDAEQGPSSSGNILAPWGDGFILLRRPASDTGRLVQVRLNPLRVDPIATPDFDEEHGRSFCLSRDERRLVVYGEEGYQVYEFGNNRWKPTVSGSAAPFLIGDSLEAVALSSNSRVLFVATESEARVIDLATGKVIKELSEGGHAAAFAPDDSVIVVAQHSGLGVLNPRTWTWRDPPAAQHDCPVEELIALPDNETLISKDHKACIVWDLPSRRPRAFLKSKRNSPFLGSPVLANNNREIIAGDSMDFLRWQLPDLTAPAPERPAVILGQPAFGGLPNQAEDGERMSIFGDPAGKRFITVQGGNFGQLRNLDSPGMVKTLSSLSKVPYLVEQDMAFLSDGKVAIFGAVQGLFHLELAADQLTKVPVPPMDGLHQGGWLQERRTYLTIGKELRVLSAETGQILHSLKTPGRYWSFHRGGSGFRAALSADGKLAAAHLDETRSSTPALGLWDVESGNLLAVHEMPDRDVGCLTFSQDGKLLIVGHANTAISLLDVEKLKAGGGTRPTEEKPPVAAPPQNQAKYAYARATTEPEEAVADRTGHLWNFRPDGSCAVEGRLPSFGVLRVNGKAMETKAVRYLRRLPVGSFLRGQYVSHDGEVKEENAWVSRSLTYHPNLGDYYNVVHAVDGLTNTSDDPIRLEVVFEVRFPADAKGLITETGGKLDVPADGNFTLPAHDHWVAPGGSGKPGETVAAVRVNTWTSPKPPRLHWNASSQVLNLTYDVTIPPAETRWMVHAIALAKRSAEGATDIITFPESADVGFVIPPGNQAAGINFAFPDLWKLGENDDFHGPFPSSMAWSSADPKPKPESDGLGFAWEARADGGRTGGLGASSVLTPWFNRQPASFAAENLLQMHANGQLIMRRPAFSFPGKRISVNRNTQMTEDKGATVWHDVYRNYGEEPVETTVSYVTTFRTPVIAVWDALGKKHDPGELGGAVAGLGGACAFVLEGEQQPATLLAFHREGAAVAPTWRWIGPAAVALDYTLKLGPNESGALLHGACQRPLTAFGGAAAAFADWLPLKVPPPPTNAQPKAGDAPAPILNYSLPN